MSGTQRLVAGRYRLIHSLAEGGFGRVWKAHDELLRADVVVKEVRLPPTADPDERAKRLTYADREARNAARLRHHPGVVPVYDVAIEDGRPWIVMQLVDGGSLEERLRAGPLRVDEAVELADALLNALDAAHRAGVVHRDVKPANVMLASDGRILLTDFGIATHPADTRLTVDGSIIGSLEYMAPERLNGDPGTPAPASDLFSLGVTLYQAVEGTSPFRRDSYPATMAAIARETPPPPRRAGRLTPLIRALLAKNPVARPTIPEAFTLLHTPPSSEKKREKPTKGELAAEPTAETVPQEAEPFEESWTGKENLEEFSLYLPAENGGKVLGLLASILTGIAGIGPTLLAVGDVWPRAIPLVIVELGILRGVYNLLAGLPRWVSRRYLKKEIRPRALDIDENGITTADFSGVQHIPWNAIRKVAIRYSDKETVSERCLLALHLKMHEPQGGESPKLYRPAGWPLSARLPEICRGPKPPEQDDWVPVCVLGPLPEPRRLELKNVVTAFAEHPLKTPKGW